MSASNSSSVRCPPAVLALRRRHPDIDLVLLPPASSDPPRRPDDTAPAGLVTQAADAVALIEELVGRPVDEQHRHWRPPRLLVRAAHHHLRAGESVALLVKLLARTSGAGGWCVEPVATRRPAATLWSPTTATTTRLRAWPGALTLHTVGVEGERLR